MRTFWLVSASVLGLLASEAPAAAQALVEYGAAASASATAASAAKGAGNGIAGLFDGLGKALNAAQDQTMIVRVDPVPNTHPTARTKTGAAQKFIGPVAPPPPPPSYEDAMGIQKSMSCDEVVRRFGPPAMSFASEDDARTMSYTSKAGGVQVECQRGKVASVEKPL